MDITNILKIIGVAFMITSFGLLLGIMGIVGSPHHIDSKKPDIKSLFLLAFGLYIIGFTLMSCL